MTLTPDEIQTVHRLHVELKAKGCTARVADLYDRCACGRGKYRWLPRCHWCHEKMRVA